MSNTTSVRRILPAKKRNFGRISDEFPVPDLTQIQTRSYERFSCQAGPARQQTREESGLEGVFREIFPIESYDKTLKLEFLRYDLGKPLVRPGRVPAASSLDLRAPAARLAAAQQGVRRRLKDRSTWATCRS